MALWSRVTETDRLKLLSVLQMAKAEQVRLARPAADGMDEFWAVGCILAGAIHAVWIQDHTLLLYQVQKDAWHSPEFSALSELLVFKFAHTKGHTFQPVLSTLDELARHHGVKRVVVGTGLSSRPAALIRLYETAGYTVESTLLTKEVV